MLRVSHVTSLLAFSLFLSCYLSWEKKSVFLGIKTGFLDFPLSRYCKSCCSRRVAADQSGRPCWSPSTPKSARNGHTSVSAEALGSGGRCWGIAGKLWVLATTFPGGCDLFQPLSQHGPTRQAGGHRKLTSKWMRERKTLGSEQVPRSACVQVLPVYMSTSSA